MRGMQLKGSRIETAVAVGVEREPITVFLDIDGPLATSSCWGMDCDNKWGWYLFDPRCVEVLNKVNNEFNIKWVLSSSWRLHAGLDDLNEYFRFRELNIRLSDTTSIINFSDPKYFYFEGELGREVLIREYVVNHGVEKFLVIDDLNMDFDDENMVFVFDDREGLFEEETSKRLFAKLKDLEDSE